MSPRKTYSILLVLVSLAGLALSACAPAVEAGPAESAEATEAPATAAPGEAIGGQAELIEALEAAGAEVEPGETFEESVFDIPSHGLKVNGADVQVFEFENEASREAASALISENGSEIGTVMVTWIDQPNFWAKGRVIVLYVGKDPATIELLTGLLGDPITSHE